MRVLEHVTQVTMNRCDAFPCSHLAWAGKGVGGVEDVDESNNSHAPFQIFLPL